MNESQAEKTDPGPDAIVTTGPSAADATINEILRRVLPFVDPGVPIDPDTPLADYGLDSLALISLMLDLEEALDIVFPDDQLNPAAFATARVLRETIGRLPKVA